MVLIALEKEEEMSFPVSLCTQRKGCMRIQQEDSYLQTRKRGFTRNRTLLDLNLKLSSLQNYEKINFCCVSHVVCGILL